jgi:hypothetical protein
LMKLYLCVQVNNVTLNMLHKCDVKLSLCVLVYTQHATQMWCKIVFMCVSGHSASYTNHLHT